MYQIQMYHFSIRSKTLVKSMNTVLYLKYWQYFDLYLKCCENLFHNLFRFFQYCYTEANQYWLTSQIFITYTASSQLLQLFNVFVQISYMITKSLSCSSLSSIWYIFMYFSSSVNDVWLVGSNPPRDFLWCTWLVTCPRLQWRHLLNQPHC